MSWTEATDAIAAEVAAKYGIPVSDALREAVRRGIEYECTCWVRQTR